MEKIVVVDGKMENSWERDAVNCELKLGWKVKDVRPNGSVLFPKLIFILEKEEAEKESTVSK